MLRSGKYILSLKWSMYRF